MTEEFYKQKKVVSIFSNNNIYDGLNSIEKISSLIVRFSFAYVTNTIFLVDFQK